MKSTFSRKKNKEKKRQKKSLYNITVPHTAVRYLFIHYAFIVQHNQQSCKGSLHSAKEDSFPGNRDKDTGNPKRPWRFVISTSLASIIIHLAGLWMLGYRQLDWRCPVSQFWQTNDTLPSSFTLITKYN